MKVLFHIDSQAKWPMVLGNVANMLQYGRENDVSFEIEVVANGDAVANLRQRAAVEAELYPQMERLSREKVAFAACRNALNNLHIEAALLCPFVAIVPAGVVEIAARQQDGFAYIKP